MMSAFPLGPLQVRRSGYGAMQLAGPFATGTPPDRPSADRLGVRFVPIHVTDDASAAKAAADVEVHEGRVDTLINNAGITGRHVQADELTGADATLVFDTNVASIVRVTHAFLPLLGRSDAPAVITSGLRSFARTHDPERVESTFIARAGTSWRRPRSVRSTEVVSVSRTTAACRSAVARSAR